MRILVLSKRQYTGKDLLDDRYGRLFELPVELARLGHEVRVHVLSYRRRGQLERIDAGIDWRSFDLLPSPFVYWCELKRTVEELRPNVIWASSDEVHSVIGSRLGALFGVPVIIDLYDDYEAFGLDHIPGLRMLYRSACRKAAGLTAVGQSLVEMLRLRGASNDRIEVIGNGVKAGFGQVRNPVESRKILRLPVGQKLVGTAGALDASRGIEDLFFAFNILRSQDPNLRLVVAGPRKGIGEYLAGPGVIDLGILPHAQIPVLFSALDVGVVCNRDSSFGRTCHPQKLVEMVACQTPVVASSIGEAAQLLTAHPESLYAPGNAKELADRIAGHLKSPVHLPLSMAPNWDRLALKLESFFVEAIRESHANSD